VLREESQRISILLEITRSEALISRVKGAEMILRFDDVEDVVPLSRGWVNTSWIVCANMEQDYGVVLCVFKVFSKSVEVKSFGYRVVVAVVLPFFTNNLNETSVKGPGGVWHKDINILMGVPISKELQSETEGTSSRNCLGSSDTAFFKLLAVRTES